LEDRRLLITTALADYGDAIYEAKTAEYSGVVKLYNRQGDLWCTGSLLPTGRHILTAAHCDADLPIGEFPNQIFQIDRAEFVLADETTPSIDVANRAIHPDWGGRFNFDLGHDIAILRRETQLRRLLS